MIWDEMECSIAKPRDSTIKLYKPICAIGGSVHNYHWAEVTGLHLAAEVSLNAQVANEYKCTRFEVMVADGVFEGVLELLHGVKVAMKDVSMNSSKVSFAPLKLAYMDG